MINVTIKTLDSLNRDFSVPDDYTVQQLKDHIADAVQMPAESQRLIYLGRVLQNETKLSEADVNGKVIHLVERAPPQIYQQYDTIGQNASVNQTRYLHEPRRNETGPGTMYLGAMAFPADLMESQGIAIPQPRQGLTTSRIFIARTMLRRAQTVISRLENTIGSLPHISGWSEFDTFLDGRPVPDPSTSTQNTFETASTSDQPDIDMQMDESEDTSNGTSEMAGLETGLDLRNWTDGNGLHIVIGPNFRNTESINIPPVPPNNTENMETETPNTSGETRRNDRFPNGNTNENGDGNRGITCTSSMAGVLGMMVRTQRRLWPYLRAVERILAEDMPLSDQTPITAVQAQTIFNSVSEVMHDLSHAFHALSDIMCNFSVQPPRSLRCRPVLIQHSAVVHTGMIPGNRIANINLRNYLRPRDTESTTTTASSNAGISTTTPTVVTASGSSNSSNIPADEITVSHPRISIAHAGPDSNEIPAIVIEEEVEISRSDAENGNAALPGYVVELPSLIQIDSVEATIVTSSSDPTRPTTVTSTGPIHVGQTLPSNVIQNMISMVNDHLRRRQSSSASTEATPTGSVNQPQTENNLTNGSQTSNSQTESVRISTGSSRTTEASNSSSNNNQTANDNKTIDSSRISDAGRVSVNSQTTEVNGTSENNQTTTENTQITDSGGRTPSENQAGNTSHSERSRPREQHIFIQRPRGTRSNFMPHFNYSPNLGREQRRFQSNSRVRRLPLPTGFDFSGIGRAYDPFLPCNSHHIQSRSSNSTTSRNSRSTNTDANMAGADNIVNANGNSATATATTESESRENSSTVNGENSTASGATEQTAAVSPDTSAERTDGQPPSSPQTTNSSAAPFPNYPQFSSRPPYSGFRMIPSRDIPYFFGPASLQTASRNSTSANTSSNRTNQSSTSSNGTSSQDRSSSSSPEANIERSAENLAAAFAAAAVGILQTTFNLDEAPRVAVIQRNDNEPRTNGTTEQQSTNINNNVSDRIENADENEEFPMTVTQPISLGAPLFDENLGSFFMDFVNAMLRGLPFSQIMELHNSDIQRLSLNFRKLFRQYLIYHFFPDGFEKCLATEVVNKLFNNHIVTFRQILDSPDIRADIDLVSTICRFNHMNIPDLLACVMSHDNDEVFALRFPRMMRLYLGQLATLVKSCLINNNDNLKKIMLSLVDKCAEELPDDPVMLSWLRENLPQHMISYESRPIAELPGFMKDYIVFRLPDPVDLPDLAEEVSSQSFMMEIEDLDRDVSMKGVVEDGNENKENKIGNEQNGLCQDSGENGNVNSAEQFQNLLIEPEGWHNSVPAEWVPIITRDVQKLRRQGSQPPFSDAYLTGMPSKRRRLLPEHKSDVDRTSDDTVLSDNSHSLRNSGVDEPKK